MEYIVEYIKVIYLQAVKVYIINPRMSNARCSVLICLIMTLLLTG